MESPSLAALGDALTATPAVRLAVVFGSAARGRARPGSDLDLGVLLDEDEATSLWELGAAVGHALRQPVDLIDLRTAPPLLRFEIARDGVPVLEREAGEWKRFRVRALLDWWDWAPTARRLQQLAVERLRREVAGGSS